MGLGVGTKDMVAAGIDRITLNKGRLMSALVSVEITKGIKIRGTSILVSALHKQVPSWYFDRCSGTESLPY